MCIRDSLPPPSSLRSHFGSRCGPAKPVVQLILVLGLARDASCRQQQAARFWFLVLERWCAPAGARVLRPMPS
eukprot:2798774-Alexandrium_andersonii.AAC.1